MGNDAGIPSIHFGPNWAKNVIIIVVVGSSSSNRIRPRRSNLCFSAIHQVAAPSNVLRC